VPIQKPSKGSCPDVHCPDQPTAIRHIGATVLKQTFLHPKKEEILEIDKMLKLNNLPSLLYRVHFVHTIKQTPRQKWLRHYWLCPPTTQSKKSVQEISGRDERIVY